MSLRPTAHGDIDGSATLRGRVISGRKKMSAYVAAEREKLREQLGFELVDGSLNLILDRPVKLLDAGATYIDGDRAFWPAFIDEIATWIYRPPGAPEHVIELVSAHHLRTALGLKDGDELIISLPAGLVVPLDTRQRLVWSVAWLGRRSWYYSWDMYLARVGSVRRATAAIRQHRYRDLGRQLRRALSRPALIFSRTRGAKGSRPRRDPS